MKRVILLSLLGLFYFSSYSQSCPTTIKNPWQWPSHRNWFFAPNSWTGMVRNMSTATNTTVGIVGSVPVTSYEGISAASDDYGNLLFYTNGRKVWTGTGASTAVKYSGVMEGYEKGGSNMANGSAAQGIITVRHPLNPNNYYLFTTDDAQGSTVGFNYAVVDKNGNVVTASTRIGSYRSTEGVAATWHANGVDIWITTMGSGTSEFYTYLLKCNGLVTTPVVSTAPPASGQQERGGLAFSWDSKYFVSAHPNNWPNETRSVSVYKFNNATGVISDEHAITPAGTLDTPYDVVFSPDNSKVYVSGQNSSIYYYDITSWNVATMTASRTSTGVSTVYSAIEIGPDGNLYTTSANTLMKLTGNLNAGGAFTTAAVAGTAGQTYYGLPSMFLPPQEEPDIQEVPAMKTCDAAVDLSTKWLCSGLDAEDPAGTPPSVYTASCGACIVAGTGLFNPNTAGVGHHQIIFTKCSVDDTIFIDVTSCTVTCLDTTLKNGGPICVGTTLDLTTMLTNTSAPGTWSVQSAPAGATPASISGTTFSAVNTNTIAGSYILRHTLNPAPSDASCPKYSERTVIVNALPTPTVADKAICAGDPAATFDAGSYSSYVWSVNGSGTSQTTSGTAPGNYTVQVTDAKGCKGSATGVLTVNPLPTPTVANNAICTGDPAATFNAGSYASYVWSVNGNGTSQTTSGTAPGNYTVQVTDAKGCKASATGVLTVNPLPTPTVASKAICAGDPAATFDAGSYSSYVWSVNGSGTSQTTSGTTPGNYTVQVTDAKGCKASATGVLTVNPLPTPTLADKTICAGDPAATFDAGTYSSYVWSVNGNGTSQTTSGTAPGNYTVQ
ncbi:MAG: hypothetical protein NT150_09270, partial [Bacteroidetes bacterium]|nr:hypothetical protein [Bacteroidota bacterium]